MHPVHLGTINLEPHRWRPDLPPLIRASEWDSPARAAGFSGLELWQRHVLDASAEELARLCRPPLAPAIFGAYVSFEDTPEARALRERVSAAIRDTAARAVKFNLGPDPARRAEYLREFRAWAASLPADLVFLNECHPGDIAETPQAAASLAAELNHPQLGIIVHAFSISEPELHAWFDHCGQLVRHVHVQHRHDDALWRRLSAAPERNASRCRLLRERGFAGSFTIEFTEGVAWARPDPARGEDPRDLFSHAVADLQFLRSHF